MVLYMKMTINKENEIMILKLKIEISFYFRFFNFEMLIDQAQRCGDVRILIVNFSVTSIQHYLEK